MLGRFSAVMSDARVSQWEHGLELSSENILWSVVLEDNTLWCVWVCARVPRVAWR